MVAKSYQGLELIGEPYIENKRTYIKVRTKKGDIKQVRWYDDKEYAKLYPEDKKVSTIDYKRILGFANGYITIFDGEAEEYFEKSSACYSRYWGWYFWSTEPLPDDLPSSVTPRQLLWEEVSLPDGSLKPEKELITIAHVFSNTANCNIDDSVDIEVTIEKNEAIDHKTRQHTMRDADGHIYIWITAAKDWPVGTKRRIRGIVKDIQLGVGVILTRCKEI